MSWEWTEWSHHVLMTFNHIVLFYFIALNGIYFLMSMLAFRSLKQYSHRLKSIDVEELILNAGAPPITVIAPGYNEGETCVESVRSLMTLRYPDYTILFVNDGSTDDTLQRLTDAFDLKPATRIPTAEIETHPIRGWYHSRKYPMVWVLDKENGGKSDSLNAGLNYCTTPLYCGVDADGILERDALIRIVRPFLENDRTIAAGGIIRIVNDCDISHGVIKQVNLPRKMLPRFQVLEYLRAFLTARMGWGSIEGNLIISGAFGLFRRQAVVAVGGYDTTTVGEDMELVVRLHSHCREHNLDYHLGFIPDPVAWTECPDSLKILGRQRDRWQRGLLQALSKHRHMIFNPKYGTAGCFAFPYYYFLEMLGPLIETLGYIVFIAAVVVGIVSFEFAVAFVAVAIFMGIALSIAAVGLEEITFRRYPRFSDLIRLMLLAVIENFGYRQMTTFWRVRGLLSGLMGRKDWGNMEKTAFRGRRVVAQQA